VLLLATLLAGCSTTKSKDDQSKFKQLYHNTTSKYNGFFNAEEIMAETIMELDAMHVENYNKTLSVYDYVEADNPTAVTPQLDQAIEKVITVATVHDLSNYVDDCYVLMGKAQYLKQDYASAEETFQFFQEEFDPKNPYGREYTKSKRKKKSTKERKKEMQEKRKEADDERKELGKEREDKREKAKKEREAEQKRRKKAAKERKKKGSSRSSKSDKIKDTGKKKKLTDEEKAALKAAEEKQKEEERYEKEKAKLKAAEEERKKKESRPQGEGGVFKNKTAYYRGLYWLARTYIEMERFTAAAHLLDRLENTTTLEKDIARQIPAARAHLLMKSREYDAALVALQNAVDKEKDKKLKARYSFIRGQLYEQQNSVNLAYDEYKKAKDYSPDYELKFNATLNEVKLAYRTGNISRDKVESKLDKMLKEAKNEPYIDQIFFTLAQVKLDAGDIDEAIADFGAALESSGGNKNVKQEAYYKLATLLYQQGYYTEAKKNYDSALAAMPKTDERYKEVERLSRNLTDIATYSETLALQDSLLALSSRPEEELKDMAREQLAIQAEKNSTDLESLNNKPSVNSNRQLGMGRSNFFAYNQIVLNQGKTEFRRLWKERVLEDNWRRSLRTDATLNFEDTNEEDEGGPSFTDEQLDEYLRDIPRSDAQKLAANAKIQNALLGLGIEFREKLKNYEKSAEALERLVNEYPDFNKRDQALYYLQLSYRDLNMPIETREILEMMKKEFPDSKYTKLATDPSYASELRSGENNLPSYYEKTYELFEQGDHTSVLDRVINKSKMFPDQNEYDPKFDLLRAMSLGNTEGKTRYIKELQELIRRHKGTPEEIRATEILRFLNGDATAFNEILYDEGVEKFEINDDKLHYAFVVVYDQNKNIQDIKISLDDYNKKFHRSDKLTITNIVLNAEDKSHIVLVRSFENKARAMAYYQGAKKNQSAFLDKIKGETIGYDLFTATQKNYRELVKQRNVTAYREFFNQNYK